MKKLLLFGFTAILFAACGTTPAIEKESTNESETTKTEKEQTPKEVKFNCQDFEENENGKLAIVTLMVDGKETFRDTINACQEFEKANYAEMGVPADALDVTGGWWAGGGDYFYVMLKDNKPVVYKGWQDEGQDDKGYHWEAVKQ